MWAGESYQSEASLRARSVSSKQESGAERSALWHVVHDLSKCGVRGLPTVWPTGGEWQVLQQQASQHLAALADVRTDNASLICRHFRAPSLEPEANDSAEAEPARGSRVPRCPRCGWAVARDQDVQSALLFLHRDLQISVEDQAGDRELHFIENTAACAGEIDLRAREFFELWNSGGLSGFTRDVREDDEIRVPSHWNKLVTNLEC
eukprot:s1699_g9.t2